MDLRGDVERFSKELTELFGPGLDGAKIAVDIFSPAMVGVLQERYPKASFVDGQALMISARRQKTPEEIACMKMAYVISEAGMQAAVDILRPGVREVELLGACLKKLWDFGSETTQCSEVVNSGPGGFPYRRFHSDRIVQHGDLVNMDFGACFNGYFGDYCRAFVCGGKATAAQAGFLKRAAEAQMEVFELLKPGASPAELCAKLKRKTMGHGIGIAAFESPHLRAIDDYEIRPGMTFSITSPVIGSPEAGGVHLEDELYLTDDGVVVYSTYPYTLA
jgi:Xaa-Pro aminopeptidase